MKSTGQIITEIVEAYAGRYGTWVRVAEIAEASDLTPAELAAGIAELMLDTDFRAESEPFGHRVTQEDRDAAPMIGGEPRHLIRWDA